MPNEIEKAAYIKARYNHLLTWEDSIRGGYQLVSNKIITKAETHRVYEALLREEPEGNKEAYFAVPSSTGGFRICANLKEINEWHDMPDRVYLPSPVASSKVVTSASSLEKIANFLNKVHAPAITHRGATFQCVWGVEKGRIFCQGPSLIYQSLMRLGFGCLVKQALENEFSKVAQDAGFDPQFISEFNEYLISEDHKEGCYYYFDDPGYIDRLAKLAKGYENATSRHFATHATSGALLTKLPAALTLFRVGKYVSVEDAAILAQVNRAGRAAAKIGKALDEQEEESKIRYCR